MSNMSSNSVGSNGNDPSRKTTTRLNANMNAISENTISAIDFMMYSYLDVKRIQSDRAHYKQSPLSGFM